MFTLPHFIWLLAIALSITALLLLSKKFSPTHSFVQKAVMIGLVAMKIFHTALSMEESDVGGGYIVKQTNLDFHLCSIQIYLAVLINVVKNEKFVKLMFTAEVDKPIVANVIKELGIDVSIMYAETKLINDRVCGQVIFRLPNYSEDIKKLTAYLSRENVPFEEVDSDALY